MRNARVQALKLLNKTLSTYPNMYFALHEGIADSAVATVSDQNTANGFDLTVAVPGATQWGATLGNFEPAAANTTQYINIDDVSGSATAFDSLFDSLNTSAWMICFNIDYVRDDAASQWLFEVRDMSNGVNGTTAFEMRLNPGVSELDIKLYDSTGAIMSQANKPTAAEGEQFWAVYVDMRTGVKASTVYRLDPGTSTHNIVSGQTFDATAGVFTAPGSAAGEGTIQIGARKLAASQDKHMDVAGVRDLRFINFGITPPSDIVNLIEELSVNSNVGTRRTY